MDTKKLLVSFSLAVLAILMVATVSATTDSATTDGFRVNSIKVDGIDAMSSMPSVDAGDSVAVQVKVEALNLTGGDASNIEVELRLKNKDRTTVVSRPFTLVSGSEKEISLKLEIPFELKDDLSKEVTLEVIVSNEDYESEESVTLRVQRPSYNPVIKSITVSQSVEAGETFPVDIVLKNMGYDDLDDLYVTVAISELGVYKTIYSGDLVPIKTCNDNDCDEEDTVTGRLFLEVPYGVEAGVYTLEVTVENDDVVLKATKSISVENDFAENVIVVSSSKTVSVGEDAEFTLLLVNPTNSLKVYRLVSESNSEVTSETESLVAVPAGSSATVTVKASSNQAGSYNFNVNVFSGDKLESTVTLTLNAQEKSTTNPVIVLTVILAIIFLVLLVVLIVLLGKKPAKTEEFGESYY